ncbi:hypothetical protein KIN20_012039 [Parelaphostrongylus tenuis]|uniref:Phosphoenolpyruvate carboxykinase C-terminal P-loop domain-containing protein n=1 Tax=Parelaphostrongylus tenuis TaxID=148309 RepID=A0AAD5QQ96_PARTN|nr:hypothetical protein KIN20_012039 [Parelaphostrongylus tenuis]
MVPRIYHVNWFRRDANNKFLWPGYGENIRVIDWIVRRLDGESDIGIETPIGIVPKKVGPDLPPEIRAEMDAQEERINKAA